ncbi:MAG: PGPGW domain-containing protein [Nocardioidaceae bacterium]
MRKIWVTMAGWVLVIAGVAALALPGPGLLLLLAGMVVLSQEYDWAERRVEPVKEKAFDVAKAGVTTYPRILFSALAALRRDGGGRGLVDERRDDPQNRTVRTGPASRRAVDGERDHSVRFCRPRAARLQHQALPP